jgi:YidC/Oxa1 family membrane protein insertase
MLILIFSIFFPTIFVQGMDSVTMAEGQKKMKNLFKEYGVTPFTPMKGMFIQGPLFICFFLAIRNMAEKVPSFQTGGALWFTDLTTPDSLYILPVITGLTFLITVECNAQEGMEGNPMAGTVKTVCRVFALLTVPMTMSFPQVIIIYRKKPRKTLYNGCSNEFPKICRPYFVTGSHPTCSLSCMDL